MNKQLLINKYSRMLPDISNPQARQNILDDLKHVKDSIKFENLTDKPLLIYSINKKQSISYILALHYALQKNRLLDYATITGQTLINQHFLTENNRDNELYNNIYHGDLTFIFLSQFDYTSEYLESLIIDLIEFRMLNNRMTIIIYDIAGDAKHTQVTKKLQDYFASNKFQIVELDNSISKQKKKATEKGRIV